jgi:hypothetical protein
VLAIMQWLLALLFLFFGGGSLLAQLTWETRVVQLAATPKDDFVEGVFRFKNTGDHPVSILKTVTTCGCTSAKVEKRAYAPGESGALVQRYRIGWNRGLHNASIRVVTDDSPSPTILGMRVMIEKIAEAVPEVLWWKVGDSPSPQEVTIKIVRSTPLELVSAKASNSDWAAKLETVTPGWEYRLRVVPGDLSRAQSAVVAVNAQAAQESLPPIKIRARVK